MNWVLVGVFAYILLQLLVGVAVSRRVRSESDYLIAGRSLGLGLATFSMFATWFGAETCVSAAGKFYQHGLAGGATDPFGYALALFLIGWVFAILSTVDSTLLAAASLISHNFVVSLKPDLSDRKKLLLARAGVAVFGAVAYGLALGAESIFELVQQANGIGSAGILVLMVFGLFSRRAGARAGYATLVVGLGVWAYGTWLGGWSCPYLISLGAALGAFSYLSRRKS